jgi:hypothetical protein
MDKLRQKNPWPQPQTYPEAVLIQRLAAAELAIKGLQEQIADSVECPPARECQPAAGFTVEQMAAAISQWLDFGESANNAGYFKSGGWAARALRAARDHILAGKAAG